MQVAQWHLRQLSRGLLHAGVAAVDQHLHRLAAFSEAPRQVRRHNDANADLATPHHVHQLVRCCCLCNRFHHAGGQHRLQDFA